MDLCTGCILSYSKDRSSWACSMGHSEDCRPRDGMEVDSLKVQGSSSAGIVRNVEQVQAWESLAPLLVWMVPGPVILTNL